jgi:hypothetical protein
MHSRANAPAAAHLSPPSKPAVARTAGEACGISTSAPASFHLGAAPPRKHRKNPRRATHVAFKKAMASQSTGPIFSPTKKILASALPCPRFLFKTGPGPPLAAHIFTARSLTCTFFLGQTFFKILFRVHLCNLLPPFVRKCLTFAAKRLTCRKIDQSYHHKYKNL